MTSFSPPITTSDAQKIVQNWVYYNGTLVCTVNGPMAPAAAAAAAASKSTTSSTVLKGTALVGGLGAIGLAWYAVRYGVSIPKAVGMVYRDAKTGLARTTRKLRARL